MVATVLAGLVSVVAATGPTAAPAAASDAADYVGLIDQLRASQGLGPLRPDATLDALATQWASHLAGIGGLQHASDLSVGVTRPWAKLGENVGLGPDTGTIFDAFVASPAHYRNLVDPTFTHVGVGVVWVGGRQYTVHRFLAAGDAPEPADEAPPEPLARTRPPVVTPAQPAVAGPAPDATPEPEPVPVDLPRPTEAPARFAAVALALAHT